MKLIQYLFITNMLIYSGIAFADPCDPPPSITIIGTVDLNNPPMFDPELCWIIEEDGEHVLVCDYINGLPYQLDPEDPHPCASSGSNNGPNAPTPTPPPTPPLPLPL